MLRARIESLAAAYGGAATLSYFYQVDARPLFKVAMDQEPGLFEPRYEYAVCSRILGEQEVAETILTELVDEKRAEGPSRQLSMALTVLGVLHNRTGRLD